MKLRTPDERSPSTEQPVSLPHHSGPAPSWPTQDLHPCLSENHFNFPLRACPSPLCYHPDGAVNISDLPALAKR